jgi:hypothetical protein
VLNQLRLATDALSRFPSDRGSVMRRSCYSNLWVPGYLISPLFGPLKRLVDGYDVLKLWKFYTAHYREPFIQSRPWYL